MHCTWGQAVSGQNPSKHSAGHARHLYPQVAYKAGELVAKQSLRAFLGEDKLKTFINFVLHYIADLDIPIKRGTFVEFRNGMLVSMELMWGRA